MITPSELVVPEEIRGLKYSLVRSWREMVKKANYHLIQWRASGADIGGVGQVNKVNFTGAGVSSAVVGDTLTVTIASGGGGGSTIAAGAVTIDFGNFPGLNEITATITGQATIVSGSKVTAWLSPLVTSNHTVEDHLFALNIINVTAGNIVAATGFTIYARSMDKLQGVYNLNWMWV